MLLAQIEALEVEKAQLEHDLLAAYAAFHSIGARSGDPAPVARQVAGRNHDRLGRDSSTTGGPKAGQ